MKYMENNIDVFRSEEALKKDDDDGPSRQTKYGNLISDAWHVLQSIRIRRDIQDAVGLHRFLLDYCENFLPYCGIVLWTIFLLFGN